MPLTKAHLCVLVVFVLLSVFSLRLIFATGDPVGFSDLSPMFKLDQLFRPFDFPWDYKSNLGSPVFLTGNTVYNAPLLLLSLVFGSVALAHKVFLVLLMAFSGFGFYLAFSYLFKSKSAGFVAGLVMLFCPFILARWMFGHNTILLAYVVLSFALFLFLRVMRVGGRLNVFLCGLFVGLMIYISPQVAYMFILFMFLYVAFDVAFSLRRGLLKRFLGRSVQLGLVLAVIFAVSLPFFYQLLMVNLNVYSTRAEEVLVSFLSPKIMSAVFSHEVLAVFACISFVFLWWKNGFRRLCTLWRSGYNDSLSSSFIGAGLRQVVFFAVLGLLSVLIVLFASSSLEPVYQWIFNNVPGFGMFREADKFLLLSGLSLAFFLALVTEGFRRYVVKIRVSSLFWRVVPVLLISIIVLSSSLPYLSGDMGGSVKTVDVPEAYVELDDWLRAQEGSFRVAFFPPAVWATTYNWSSEWFLDPVVSLQAQPTLEIKSELDLTPSAGFARWVYTELYSHRVSDWGRFLALLGIKYLVLRLDADMLSERSDLSTFSLDSTVAALSVMSDFQLEKNFTSVLVYRNMVQLPIVYEANGFSLIVGDRRALVSLANANFDFNQNPGAFLDDNIALFSSLISDSRYVVLQGDSFWSLLVASLGSDCIVQPWVYAPVSSNPWGKWVRGDLVWWFWSGALNVAPDNFIYSEGAANITVPLNVAVSGSYRVLAQVYDGQLPLVSSGVRFVSDGAGTLDFVFRPMRMTEGSYSWVDLGSSYLDSKSGLTLVNLGGGVAVSKIAVIPEDRVEWAKNSVSELLDASNARMVYVMDDFSWDYSPVALLKNPIAGDGVLINLQKSNCSASFYSFREAAYFLRGHFLVPDGVATVRVVVDDAIKDVQLSGPAGGLVDVVFGSFNLGVGWHNITIEAKLGAASLDVALLCDSMDAFNASFTGYTGSSGYSFDMLSGSEYKIESTGKNLVFLEAGGNYWSLNGESGASVSPVTVFNYASMFFVEDAGEYTLRYTGLSYFEQSFLLAFVALALIAVGLKFLGRKRLVFEEVCC